MTSNERRRSILLHLRSTPALPVPLVAGPVLRAVMANSSIEDDIDLHVALAVRPAHDELVAFLELCTHLVRDLDTMVSCSLVGPEDLDDLEVDDVLSDRGPADGSSLLDRAHAAAQARLLRDIVHRPLQGRPLRLMVLVNAMDSWGALEPLARAGRLDPRVECTVVVLESQFSRTPTEVFDAVSAEGWHPVPASVVQGQLEYFDVIAVSDPYDEYRPAGFTLPDFLEAGARVVLSPYAENIGAEFDLQYNTPTHNLAWRVYAASEAQKRLFAAHCALGDSQVRALGSLKGDWLAAAVESSHGEGLELVRRLGTDRITLWNPHFRMGHDGWSTFVDHVMTFMTIVDEDPGLAVIARPHPMLLPALERGGGDASALAAWFRARCLEHPRLHLDEERDYRPAFAASSCLVSDLSSLIPEYLRLGRPVGYLRHPRTGRTTAEETWRDSVVVIDDRSDLQAFLRRVPGASSRRVVDGGAGARAVDDLWDGLSAEMSALRPKCSPSKT